MQVVLVARFDPLYHSVNFPFLAAILDSTINAAGISIIYPYIHKVRDIFIPVTDKLTICTCVGFSILACQFIPITIVTAPEIIWCENYLYSILSCFLYYPICMF